jgi:hypothetical protein
LRHALQIKATESSAVSKSEGRSLARLSATARISQTDTRRTESSRASPWEKKVANTWRIIEDNLCITDSSSELCYSVWKKGRDIQLIYIDSDIAIVGSLR